MKTLESLDVSTITLFSLTQGIQAALPGKHLISFRDPEEMVQQVDPTGAWLGRVSPSGRGDTLKEFCTNVEETLKKMGLSPTPTIKPEYISFKNESLTAQHAVVDKFSSVMGQLADPPHGKINFVIVNYDQALAINGATKQKVPQGEFEGNYSIVGGYDREKDTVLLLDLDKAYKAERSTPSKNSGIYWVPISDLVDAMNTQDADAKMNRGYLAFSIPTI